MATALVSLRASLPTRASTAVTVGAGLLAIAASMAALPFVAARPRLLPVLFIAGAVGAFLLLRPAWIVPSFVGVTYASIGDSFFGGLPSPVEVGAAALLVLAIWRGARDPRRGAEVLIVTLLLGLPLVAASLLHPDSLPELYDLLKRLIFLPIVALCLRDGADVTRTAISLAVVGLVLGAGAAWSVLVGPTALFPLQEAEGTAPRAAGPFGEPTFFALSLAVLVPVALSLVARGGRTRMLGYATAVALTAGVVAAGSRGALIAVFLGAVAFVAIGGSRRLLYATVLIAVTLAALIPAFAGQVGSSVDRTISGRVTENLVAVEMFADHPVGGVGPGEYRTLYRDYARGIGNDPRYERWPHSLPLEIAAEQGVIGLVAWLAAIALLIRLAVRARPWSTTVGKGLVLALLVFGFESLFQHGSQLRILYMLLGAFLVLVWDAETRRQRGSAAAVT